MTDQQFSATIYKQLFTGAEDVILFAMKDYGDFHGEWMKRLLTMFKKRFPKSLN